MNTERINHAVAFAINAHDVVNQKRKYTHEPYWTHPVKVSKVLALHGKNVSEEMIMAALLHDTIEDAGVTFEELNNLFGSIVAGYVLELTDVYSKESHPHLNRAQRKTLEYVRMSKMSPEAQEIKLADTFDNTESILRYDADFAKMYLREKLEFLNIVNDKNTRLFSMNLRFLTDYLKNPSGEVVL